MFTWLRSNCIIKDNNKNKVNNQIDAKELRLIGDDGKQIGVVGLQNALKIAFDLSLDLVEIQPNANPPVARLMDYGKFMFKQNKQNVASKKKQIKIKVKEIKFRPNTDVNDYEVKLRNIISFLNEGNKVKVTVYFRGREMIHKNLGNKLLDRVCEDVKEVGIISFYPKFEGRQLIMIISPKKINVSKISGIENA